MDTILLQSFIDIEKWDAAKWRATAFLHDPEGVEPPGLGIVYENIAAGKEIFREWLRRIGKVDEFEELRISIVEGDILGLDPGYSVHVSGDIGNIEKHARANGMDLNVRKAVVISRFHRMMPEPDSPHLPRFKKEFARHKRYFLIPVSSDCQPQLECAVTKTRIHFRQASEITGTDRDAVVFPEGYFANDKTVQ